MHRLAGRVAFFGGSFDPPHLGHLGIARAALAALKLDLVLFAPTGLQPLKPAGAAAAFADRAAMVELAIADPARGDRRFALSRLEAPGPAPCPSYTIDTLEGLRAGMPASAELFLLLGADSLATLGQWRRAGDIPFAATLIVAARPGTDAEALLQHLPVGIAAGLVARDAGLEQYVLRAGGRTGQLFLLLSPHYDISATGLRGLLEAGDSDLSDLVPEAVLGYIRKHALYRPG